MSLCFDIIIITYIDDIADIFFSLSADYYAADAALRCVTSFHALRRR